MLWVKARITRGMMDIIAEIFVVLFLGLIFGSFATALIYRVPRDISWGTKRSSCPSCGSVLRCRDLFPFFSWCLSGGKCRHCSNKIPIFYPLVELSCAGLCLAAYYSYGFTVLGGLACIAIPFLVALALIDLKHMNLPNQLILVLFVLGMLRLLYLWSVEGFAGADGADLAINYIFAAFLFSFLSWSVGALVGWVLNKESLGFGDVKFFAVAGLWLGLAALPYFLILSGVLAFGFALFWRLVRGQEVFPFGPSLIAAFFLMLLYQESFITTGDSAILF